MIDVGGQERTTYELPSGSVAIDKGDLDAIRRATLATLREEKELPEELRDPFITELENPLFQIDDRGIARIGAWLLEVRAGSLALVRHPPRTPVMHMYYAVLSRAEGRWSAVSFEHERVFLR